MKIAAQLMTVRHTMQTPEDIRSTLKKVREIGYEAGQISFGFTGKIEIPLLKSYFDEVGMTICGTHVGYDRLVNETDAVIEEHKILDTPFIGLGAMSGKRTADGYKEFCEIMNPVAQKISDAGMKLTYHNHAFEFEKVNETQTGMDVIMENTDPNTFKLLPDLYWLLAGGIVPSAFLYQYADRIGYVHYKDGKYETRRVSDTALNLSYQTLAMTEVGSGNMDWKYLTKVCREIGVPYAAVEQDKAEANGMESLEASYNYLKGIV